MSWRDGARRLRSTWPGVLAVLAPRPAPMPPAGLNVARKSNSARNPCRDILAACPGAASPFVVRAPRRCSTTRSPRAPSRRPTPCTPPGSRGRRSWPRATNSSASGGSASSAMPERWASTGSVVPPSATGSTSVPAWSSASTPDNTGSPCSSPTCGAGCWHVPRALRERPTWTSRCGARRCRTRSRGHWRRRASATSASWSPRSASRPRWRRTGPHSPVTAATGPR